jgi:hypothetical protein
VLNFEDANGTLEIYSSMSTLKFQAFYQSVVNSPWKKKKDKTKIICFLQMFQYL